MNYLAIDYGTKRIGLAITVMDIISPIDGIPNDKSIFDNLNKVISSYKIDKIFVGFVFFKSFGVIHDPIITS